MRYSVLLIKVDFSTVNSGDDVTAFGFYQPHPAVPGGRLQPGINTNGMAANDILSFNLTGN